MEFWKKLSELLKQKGFSSQQIKKLEEMFGDLDAAGLLLLSPDQLLPAMTGRTVAEKQAKIETLLAAVRQVQVLLTDGRTGLSDYRTIMEEAGVRDVFELRRIMRDPEAPREHGLQDSAISTLASFSELARFFPAHIAIALQDAGVKDVNSLEDWSQEQFERVLKGTVIDRYTYAVESARFERLKDTLKDGSVPKDAIALDLGETTELYADVREALAGAGVETWADWSAQRERVELPEKQATALDNYARLQALGVTGRTADVLISKGLHSSLDLARLSAEKLNSVALDARVDANNLRDIVNLAKHQSNRAASALDQILVRDLQHNRSLSSKIKKLIRVPDIIYKCLTCAEEQSVFSRFAYYVYLVQSTSKTLDEVEKKLLDEQLYDQMVAIFGLEDTSNTLTPGYLLKMLSPVNGAKAIPDPLADCQEITILDLLIRRLQDYLEELSEGATTYEERQRFSFLPYEAWRAERVAYYFAETAAFWRDDVLSGESGPADRGSIIRDSATNRDRLKAELELVEHALAEARLSKGQKTLDDFVNNPAWIGNSTWTDSFSSTPYFQDFQRGLAAIRNVLDADEAVQELIKHLDQDQTGLAMVAAQNALRHLDELTAKVFKPTSFWQDPDLVQYESLMARPAGQRKHLLATFSSELMGGVKAIFASDKGSLQSSINQNIAGGQVDSLDPWETTHGFRLPLPHETYQLVGKIVLEANDAEGVQGIPRQCRYRDGMALKDYTSEITVRITYGRTFGPFGINFATGERVGVCIRSSNTSNRYQLVIKSEVVDVGGPTALRHFLVLERVKNGQLTELVRSDMAPAEAAQYKFTISASGNTLSGRVERVSTGSVSTVSHIDSEFAQGTFGMVASPTISAEFGPFNATVETASLIGAPPFHAPRRRTQQDNLTAFSIYESHVYENLPQAPKGMATDLAATQLTFQTEGVAGQELAGLSPNRILLFKEKAVAVSLDGLDTLLDKCLALSLYLRFAVLPTRLAQVHLQAGNFELAVRHLHLLYDNTAHPSNAQVYPYFTQYGFSPSPDLKLLQLRLGEAYVQWADWLFRQNSPKSRHLARQHYKRVMALYDKANSCGCEMQVGTVIEEVLDRWLQPVPPEKPGLLDDPDKYMGLFEDLFVYGDSIGSFDNLVDLIGEYDPGTIDPSPMDMLEGFAQLEEAVFEQVASYNYQVDMHIRYENLMERGENLIREVELELLSDRRYNSLLEQPASNGIADLFFFSGGFGKSGWNGFHSGYEIKYAWTYGPFKYPAFCIPPNPLQTQQLRHVCLMVELINSCRNILGFTDDLVPALRFEALLRLARSFADQAHAAERDLMSFRQSFEQESYSLLQAHTNLVMSEGEVGLEMLNLGLAQGEVRLASSQQHQTTHALAHYEALLGAGLSDMEKLALGAAWSATAFSAVAATGGILSAGASAIGLAATAKGNPAGLVVAGVGIVGTLLGGAQGLAAFSSSLSSAASMQASYERRQQEWEFNKNQNGYNVLIAHENLSQAAKRYEIAGRRQQLAITRRDLAADGVQFLNNKFLNRAMWVWLQRRSREQYLTRLNYANATAFMAERALAFELQNPDLRVVRFDYFDPKRDGLLGATQLQTDLATLENMKLSFTNRKRQLTKTISMARLMPAEFEQFKQSGILPFSTSSGHWSNDNGEADDSLRLFDQDFPGHYMRLIKVVKVTVIALIPPHEGIRASLHNSGISRVVVAPPYSDTFRETSIRRPPESVALSSPHQDSGVFNLDYNNDLLLPFEGLGVATDWVFELPKAANQFDFRSIADILITLEYTALENSAYRKTVVERLGTTTGGDRSFSFRHQFSDAWYDLHNPDLVQDPQQPMAVSFNTQREDFPPNVNNLSIDQIVLYIVRKSGVTTEVTIQNLEFTEEGGSAVSGGSATTTGGIISTRQGNAGGWAVIIGQIPVGKWTLTIEDIPENRQLFEDELIEDILFVITFGGERAAWPGS